MSFIKIVAHKNLLIDQMRAIYVSYVMRDYRAELATNNVRNNLSSFEAQLTVSCHYLHRPSICEARHFILELAQCSRDRSRSLLFPDQQPLDYPVLSCHAYLCPNIGYE